LIPYLDLRAQYRSIESEILGAIRGVLESSEFILGKQVTAFEEEFAAYCQAKFAIAVNSGTSALHLSLLAAGVKPGDEIITVPFTFVATVAAIYYAGGRPVYVDIDPRTYTLDTKQLQDAITERTKAILPVHLYGHPADMDPILAVARAMGKIVIEDAAQAHGAEYRGRRTGSLGDLACFSFYPGKNLGAYGEGGIVVTDNAEYASVIRKLRDWGQSRRYHHDLRGFNYRMDGIQGAILRVKLRHLERWTEGRRAVAREYMRLLDGAGVVTPVEQEWARHVYHVFAIRSQERNSLQEHLSAKGIQTGIHYPIPVHLQKAYAEPQYGVGSFPVSEEIASQVLSLPIYPELTSEQLTAIADALHAHSRDRFTTA
jgi:dTDP-4-amino-4,6-dideoxygalactose transaminase